MDDDEIKILDVCISNETRDKAIKKAVKRKQTTIDGRSMDAGDSSLMKVFEKKTRRRRKLDESSEKVSDFFRPVPKKQNAAVGFVKASELNFTPSTRVKKEIKSKSALEDENDEDFMEVTPKKKPGFKRSKQRRSNRKPNKIPQSKSVKMQNEDVSEKKDVNETPIKITEVFTVPDDKVKPTTSQTKKSFPDKKDTKAEEAAEQWDYFSYLPLELQQRIFIHLPDDDLQNCIVVCRRWQSIITDNSFMLWKKKYHRLSRVLVERGQNSHCYEALRLVNEVLGNNLAMKYFSEDETMSMIRILPHIFSFFTTYCPSTGASMQSYLESRPLWPVMSAWFVQRFPDCLQSSGQPYAWCFLVGCIAAARTIEQIEWIWTGVLRRFPENQCVVLEFLYSLAYLLRLLSLVSLRGPWYRMHYRIAYRLRRMELSGGVSLRQLRDKFVGSGQQCILRYGASDSKLNLTHEQLKIARHELKPGDVIKINAFAGTGKTTTLLNFARFNPSKNFILIVYNKAAQLHAQKIFPKQVVCRTGHSLAFQAVGHNFRHKLGNLKHRDLVELLPETASSGESGNLFRRVKLVKNVLDNFMASEDREISIRLSNAPETTDRERSQAVREAQAVWDLMKNREHKCPIPHDGYLKLWQLSDPELIGYDAILIDEAQDMNPCILDVIRRQVQPKIFVGDPHQQIYSFRGSVNVLELVEATHVYSLTQSFRFGEPIAFVAQSILSSLCSEVKLLTGTDRKSSIHGDFERDGQLTIICRNNATVFSVAHTIAQRSFNSISVIGGLDGLGINLMLQIYYMTLPQDVRNEGGYEISDRFLLRFVRDSGSLVALVKYASLAEDVELSERIRVVQQFRDELPRAVAQIRRMHTVDQERAHFIVTTAHKSKGLEFRSVVLANDLDVLPFNALTTQNVPVSEVNLLYVAATRAKYFLSINKSVKWILQTCGENFCRMESANPLTNGPYGVFKLYNEPLMRFKHFFSTQTVSQKLELIPERQRRKKIMMAWRWLCGDVLVVDPTEEAQEMFDIL